MDNKDQKIIKRKSILENIDYHINRNIYCERKNLTNEASVEANFIERMLSDLGFKDQHIKRKESLTNLTVAKGSKQYSYKPDYCIVLRKTPKLIIDAKSTDENVFDWVEQCAHYCLLLNRKDKANQVEYFIVSNGLKTVLYQWDKEDPILELDFQDFYPGNEKYEKFRKIVAIEALSKPKQAEETEKTVVLRKITKEEAQKLFLSCHKYIWNTEKRSPQSAFTEFVKMIFLKLWNDRILHDNYPEQDDNLRVPVVANSFSVKWIESRENEILNPLNEIQFKNLLNQIQDDIDKNHKKRIFDTNENIKLKPTTIKGVVKKLEKVDLFGIDEDLNGRLFETFLNSTMRGEALGQYFTPRSIVLLATKLAELKATENHVDKVLDASCGTGGFLIEALTIMRNQIRANGSYSSSKKEEIINKVSNECLYGVDAATEPNLARIARINMYLHGDGGSHIYFADGLAKTIKIDKTDERELQLEIEDMKKCVVPNVFDAVLTNPPFSMWYEMTNEAQAEILAEYEMAIIEGTNKYRRLRGSAMFIERYKDLLKPGGKLISILDETVLSSDQYSYFRDFIRKYFIIRGVISLHGDAFQMAKARAKTALIYLEKKRSADDKQPAAFMYSSIRLGVDDLPVTTNPEKIKEARKLADEEIAEILHQFKRYKDGEVDFWLVQPERTTDRLDVKYCVPMSGRLINKWKKQGFEVKKIFTVCNQKEELISPSEHPDTKYRILTITYEGRCKTEETRLGRNINYKKMKVVREGDLVFSEYNTFHGAIGYITKEFDGALASGSYTVVRCENNYDALYLWSILRTTEIRADFLTSAIGMGRQTVSWDDIKEVSIPFLPEKDRKSIAEKILNAWEMEQKAENALKDISENLHENFNVESEDSQKRFLAAKPPK